MKKIFLTSAFLAAFIGVLLVSGGVWGIAFTYKNVAGENITTPSDAAIPGVPVRGPLTLKAQADIIKVHTLRMTDGKTYAEMPQQVPALDQDGNALLNEDGSPVMTANKDRGIWITATTLITALHLGILAYAVSLLFVALGVISLLIGSISYALSRR